MSELTPPIIYEIECSKQSLKKFRQTMDRQTREAQKLILEYPTVYMHNNKKNDKYDVYVGETDDIIRRTGQQHKV